MFVRFPERISDRDKLKVAKETLGKKKLFLYKISDGLGFVFEKFEEDYLKVGRFFRKLYESGEDFFGIAIASGGVFVLYRKNNDVGFYALPLSEEVFKTLKEKFSGKFGRVYYFGPDRYESYVRESFPGYVKVSEVNLEEEDYRRVVREVSPWEVLKNLYGKKRREVIFVFFSLLFLLVVYELYDFYRKKREEEIKVRREKKETFVNYKRNLWFYWKTLENFESLLYAYYDGNSYEFLLGKAPSEGNFVKVGDLYYVRGSAGQVNPDKPPGEGKLQELPEVYLRASSCEFYIFNKRTRDFIRKLESVFESNRSLRFQVFCNERDCTYEVGICLR